MLLASPRRWTERVAQSQPDADERVLHQRLIVFSVFSSRCRKPATDAAESSCQRAEDERRRRRKSPSAAAAGRRRRAPPPAGKHHFWAERCSGSRPC